VSSAPSIKPQVFDAAGAKVGSEFLVNTQTANGQYVPTITGYDSSGTLGDSSGTSPWRGSHAKPRQRLKKLPGYRLAHAA
jgi:hypothetical protein